MDVFVAWRILSAYFLAVLKRKIGFSLPELMAWYVCLHRRSLTGTSGSLGSKVERSWLVPSGWSTGKSVVVRPDARTAHICSLASSIVKVRP